MILLPWLDRLFSYLVGLAAWGLWIGPESSVPLDLERLGLISLVVALLTAPVLISLHRRESSRHPNQHR